MATHSSILAWRIPWTEELGGLSPWGHKELDMTGQLTQHKENGLPTSGAAPPLWTFLSLLFHTLDFFSSF